MTSPLRDARCVEDAASGASVHSLKQANANVLPAVCAEYDSPTARHDSSNGVIAKPTITTYMHTVSTRVSDMIMSCTRSWLMIRKQLMQSPANGTPSPEQQRIQKYYSLLLRIRIQASTAAPLDDEQDLFGREEALRMDEEIMDFEWCEHVTWDSI